MSMDRFINFFAIITLFQLMVTVGLGAKPAEVLALAHNWRIVTRAFLASYILVPAAAVGLLLWFNPPSMVAAGILVAVICPGAAYGPPMTSTARGNVNLSIGLMVLLAGFSAIIVPLFLKALLPVLAADPRMRIGAAKMIWMLVFSQFAPLFIGLVIRQRFPALANRMAGPSIGLSKLMNIALVGLILVVQFGSLVAIRISAYLGMVALIGFAFLTGWLLGGPQIEDRKTFALTTSVRNVGVALVILSTAFPGTPAVTSATTYMVVQTIVLVLVAVALGKYSSTSRERG